MRLLILLSALLAGLTGIIAGQPAFAHRGEQAAMASATAAPTKQARTAEPSRVQNSYLSEDAPRLLQRWRLYPVISPRGERRQE